MRVVASMRDVMEAPPVWGGITMCVVMEAEVRRSGPGRFDARQMPLFPARAPWGVRRASMPAPIATVEQFYAHALAIEREAADRYEEYAVHFADLGDDALERLCSNL